MFYGQQQTGSGNEAFNFEQTAISNGQASAGPKQKGAAFPAGFMPQAYASLPKQNLMMQVQQQVAQHAMAQKGFVPAVRTGNVFEDINLVAFS